MIRYQKTLLIVFTLLLVMTISALAAGYYLLIIKYPGSHISKENIVQLLSRESPVYYRDGQNRAGVFFDQQHRRYLKLEPPPSEKSAEKAFEDYIPRLFLTALVASEDKNFYRHHGVDYLGILRALLANLKAGHVVQGGSTLTQQCAKNIFRRTGRTYIQKFQELLNALRLEYHYTKDEILEFYCNQFYVTGNGRGLGIAARYYFNKPAKALDLIEAAYIAGSLKGPARYDPLPKQDPQERETILKRARARTDYVLARMVHQEFITNEAYETAKSLDLPFQRGKFRYTSNVILDYVRDQLESERFKKLLEAHGISNLATSGIKITTSLDRDIQEGAQAALQSHLSYLETILKGYKKVDKADDYALDLQPAVIREKDFYTGKITDMVQKGRQSYLSVSLGGQAGTVDYQGLTTFAEKCNTFDKGYYSGAGPQDVARVFNRFNKGDLIFVSVRKTEPGTGKQLLDIEQYPQIEGAVIVLDKGQVRALVGGFSNTNFNRALYAKREPGSVFKALVYLAALSLNWNNLDELINSRNVFVFQNQFYFPRPDHDIHSEKVSMTMAGVQSENVASVFLLNNLVDKLTKEQFIKIARLVGLAQTDQESYSDYIKRIRDQMGIVATEAQLKRGIFEMIKQSHILELTFLKEESQISVLSNLKYGLGFDTRLKQLRRQLTRAQKGDPGEDLKELNTQIELLERNYLSLREHYLSAKKIVASLDDALIEMPRPPAPEDLLKGAALLKQLYVNPEAKENIAGKAVYFPTAPKDDRLKPLSPAEAFIMVGPAGQKSMAPSSRLTPGNILVDGLLSLQLMDDIEENIDKNLQRLKQYRRYDMECLYYHKEFRVMVGLLYVINLAHTLGIDQDLKPVLSFPLGTNSVTLAETAKMYQSFLQGKIYSFSEPFNSNEMAIISEIEDLQGNQIYKWTPAAKSVLPPSMAMAVANILRQVVIHGTAKAADRQIKISGGNLTGDQALSALKFRFPVMGKTGTTNNYRNATFLGFLPYYPEGGRELSLANTYTIACYVGHDTNQKMVHEKGRLRISGASGALPVWIKTANHIIKSKNFADSVDMVDLAFQTSDTIPFTSFDTMIDVAVDPTAGLPKFTDKETKPALIFKTLGWYSDDEYVLERNFQPLIGN